MLTVLAFLGRHAAIVLFASIAVALAVPQVGALLVDHLRAIIVALLTLAILRIEPARVLAQVRRPARLSAVVLAMMVAQPLILLAVAPLLDLPPAIVLGLLLVTAAPPIASATNFAMIMGLDGAFALGVTVTGLLLVPLTAPVLVGLAGPIELDGVAMFVAMIVNLAIAVGLAAVLRRIIGAERLQRHGQPFDGVVAIAMLVFMLAVMSDVGRQLAADWRGVAALLLVAIVANYGLQLVTAVAARAVGASAVTGNTAALLAGNRNFGLMVAALPAATAEPLLALLALYQIPMYATPLLCGRLYRRLT